MKSFKSFQQFVEVDKPVNNIQYSEYIAEKVNEQIGQYSSSGIPSITSGLTMTLENHLPNFNGDGEYLGKSRLDGGNLYRKDGNVYNDKNTNFTTIENKTIDIPHVDNFGSWTKNDNSSTTFQKWMIGLGLGSLIVGVISIIVMILI